MSDIAPIMLGLRGPVLGADERAFIERVRPAAFILFARNIESPEQMRALCEELAGYSPWGYPLIAVDQEGGRVQRVKFGGALPPMRVFGEWYDTDKDAALEGVRLTALLLAAQLREVGATWALAPVLDVAHPKTHAIIGDRAFHDDPEVVAALGMAYLEGTATGGCFGCLKHAPGHGRAMADSHVELPRVEAGLKDLERDMVPFRALAGVCPFMMTAHIDYPALGTNGPITYDEVALAQLRGAWGFNGIWLADDLGMEALGGSYPQRAKLALGACGMVITSFSKIKHGMAGTVFDEEAYAAFAESNIPPMSDDAQMVIEGLTLPPAPTAEAVEEAKAKLKALWADGPERMGYKLPL
jgi:beta-N-acetylhexosaminidase